MVKLRKSSITKLICIAMVLVLMLASFSGCGKKKEEPTTTIPTTQATTLPPPPAIVNPLTGEVDYPEALIGNRSVLVSVENHPQARPQWGIASADIVWELLAEGGITRMLCMFADASRLPDKIGPTRSTRHYFVELAEGFDSIFVHFGGSPQGYKALNNQGTDHIDGMSDNYFKRDKSRNVDSEHTAYTTRDSILKAIEDKDFRTEAESQEKAKPFKFNEAAKTLPDGTCTGVSVPFSSSFTYKYTYDADKKVYLSSLNGNAFKDDNGTQQSFTNIIIVFSSTSMIDSKRIAYDLSKGEGVYISNGTYQNIKWEKGDYTDIMKFYDLEGNELSLNPGRSYIALVPTKNQSQTTIS
ncbi:MAG: DUF3048 domain-containing protein [Clostridia bacterium]|nr:DUF3048 domain-containing protein [Clostridia bacterium]